MWIIIWELDLHQQVVLTIPAKHSIDIGFQRANHSVQAHPSLRGRLGATRNRLQSNDSCEHPSRDSNATPNYPLRCTEAQAHLRMLLNPGTAPLQKKPTDTSTVFFKEHQMPT